MKLYSTGPNGRIETGNGEVLMVQMQLRNLRPAIQVGPDGIPGIKMTAKCNKEQWDAIREWAETEHTDPDELVEDMLNQPMLAWRRERDEKRGRRYMPPRNEGTGSEA